MYHKLSQLFVISVTLLLFVADAEARRRGGGSASSGESGGFLIFAMIFSGIAALGLGLWAFREKFFEFLVPVTMVGFFVVSVYEASETMGVIVFFLILIGGGWVAFSKMVKQEAEVEQRKRQLEQKLLFSQLLGDTKPKKPNTSPVLSGIVIPYRTGKPGHPTEAEDYVEAQTLSDEKEPRQRIADKPKPD